MIKPRKRDVRDGIGDKQMQENMKEYLTEKESREKRLEVYTEKIQEKVLSRSSETIRQLAKLSGSDPIKKK